MREPGTGAIEFAQPFVAGMTMETAMPTIKLLVKGELHGPEDKRVKKCEFCGYYYQDKTRPNNSKTCGKVCKVANDTLKRAIKNAEKALLKPKRKTRRDQYYIHWLEYPFWINEYEMLKQSWKHEAPYSPEKVALIAAAKERKALMGGKQKPKYAVPYSGDEKQSHKVYVKISQNKEERKPKEVQVSHMTVEEVRDYFDERYTEDHLRWARRHALEFSRSKKGI